MTAHYDDLPDTTRYYRPVPAPVSGPGLSSMPCGCVLPASCSACDGVDAERRDMWRLPRAERIALELTNARLMYPAVLRDDREQGAA